MNTIKPTIKFGMTRWHWLARGGLVGMMVMSALNSASYFFRSDGVSNLVGATTAQSEAIGFPLSVWGDNTSFGHQGVDFSSFFTNVACGVVVALAFGLTAMFYGDRLNLVAKRFIDGELATPNPSAQPLQFSMLGMMLAATILALLTVAMMNIRPDPRVLAFIYFVGPSAMVALAMAPRGVKWEHRVVLLTILIMVALAVAIWVGQGMGMEFDRVLMGIFVCWTPQSVLGAIAITIYSLWRTK